MQSRERKENIEWIIDQYINGLIGREKCHNTLDDMSVRGSFAGRTYTGYDYIEQEWIRVEK